VRSAIVNLRAILLMLCLVPSIVFGQGLEVNATYGAKSPICREVAATVRSAMSSDFRWSWRKYFDNVLWNSGSYSYTSPGGVSWKRVYRYALVDIDNDGRQDAVLLDTEIRASKEWDKLYLTSPIKLEEATRAGTVRDLMLESSGLDDGFNGVEFLESHVTAIPLELQIWRRNGETLILMLEHYAGSPVQSRPNALVVGKLNVNSEDLKSAYPHLRPNLVCRLAVSAPANRLQDR